MTQIKFYTDGHVAYAIVEQPRNRGVDIVRCEDVGLKDADDETHFSYALQEQRTIVSGDRDFIDLGTAQLSQGKSHFGIFFLTPEIRSKGIIGLPVNYLLDWHTMILGGAATLEEDVYNQIIYIG